MRKIAIKQTLSFAERCKAAALAKLDAAAKLAPGPKRDALERLAKEIENASGMKGWLKSSALQPPTW